MKIFSKYFAMTTMVLGLNTLAFADNSPPNFNHLQSPATPMTTNNQPEQALLILSSYEKNAQQIRSLNSRILKRSDANQRLCWSIINYNKQGMVKIEEHIHAPASAQFLDPDAVFVGSSPDGKYHRLDRQIHLTADTGLLEKCWQFDLTDPVGTYQIQIKVNDLEFPMQEFRIID